MDTYKAYISKTLNIRIFQYSLNHSGVALAQSV